MKMGNVEKEVSGTLLMKQACVESVLDSRKIKIQAT